MTTMADTVWLFSYGTLQQADVQQALFGRELVSFRDVLLGFDLDTVAITDRSVIEKSGSDRHPILKRGSEDATVHGSVLSLTNEELQTTDGYEASDYMRIQVVLASGREAFVYVQRDA